jgi:hypothetical protein
MIPADIPAKPIVLDYADVQSVLNLRCGGFLPNDPGKPAKTMLRLPLKPQPVNLGLEGNNFRREMYSWKKLICAPNFYQENSIILDGLPYQKNDFLWVKESWKPVAIVDRNIEHSMSFQRLIKIEYRADGALEDIDFGESLNTKYKALLFNSPIIRWHSSGTMERPAARILLKVKKVRVERVDRITPSDCYDEGIRIEPPGVFNPLRPDNWDVLSEGAKLNYAQSAARASYIAEIKYQRDFVDEFEKRWDARYGKRKGLRFADNPWVQVIEFSRTR